MRERKINLTLKCKDVRVVEPKADQRIEHVFKLSGAEKSVTEVALESMHQPITKNQISFASAHTVSAAQTQSAFHLNQAIVLMTPTPTMGVVYSCRVTSPVGPSARRAA